MRPELRVEDLSLTMEGKTILSHIDFSAREPRLGIVGRNGSGKTSLARSIAGLITPSSGAAKIGGADMARDRKAALRAVGILFQNPDHQIIFPTVEEEIGFGLGQLGLSKAEILRETAEILARFGKESWAKAGVHRLSQGQKQLVCLMSILAMRPAVILLDEPFSGLDIPTKMRLARYLDGVEAQLLHISHEPAVLAGYDRVLWIEGGEIRQDGAAAPVLEAFTQAMVRIGETDDLTDLAD